MKLIFRWSRLKGFLNWLGVLLDIFMLGLTIFDLFWLMFDALYTMATVQKIVNPILPFYKSIHDDFYFYDGIIISIFIGELVFRWTIAIYEKKYERWFYYPFVHWYDLLGCFPTGSFRILRLFRIIGLIYKLHRWEVIDLNNYALFVTLLRYYNIGIEEISDRVVVQVLRQTKEKIEHGDAFFEAVGNQVIKPQQQAIAAIVANSIQRALAQQYPKYRPLLETYILETVGKQVQHNEEIRQLGRIPVLGKQVERTIYQATSQIVFGVVDQLISDASNPDHEKILTILVDSLLEVVLQQELYHTDIGKNVILDSIDLIIDRVKVKNWKREDVSSSNQT